jgi:peptidoglycan hydrolase-like protein with peptidoglycan-binding domain
MTRTTLTLIAGAFSVGLIACASSEEQVAGAAPSKSYGETVKGMFKPEGIKKVQAALFQRGNSDVKETGQLDGVTQTALRMFQKKEGLAETGMPNIDTVRRLGISPNEVLGSLSNP